MLKYSFRVKIGGWENGARTTKQKTEQTVRKVY